MKTLVLLLCCCGSVRLTVIWSQISYFDWPRDWNGAEEYCQRKHYGSQLIIQDPKDPIIDVGWYRAWFGLFRNPITNHSATFNSSEWQWIDSINATVPALHRHPKNDEHCAVASSSDKMWPVKCSSQHFYFCQDSTGNFTFINKTSSWLKAQENCRILNQTLGTFNPSSDDSPATVRREFNVWTGLRQSGSDGVSCVAISSQSRVLSLRPCSQLFPSLCKTDYLVLEQEELSWEEAMEHCRSLSSSSFTVRLLSVDQDHMDDLLNHIENTTTTTKMWVGLRFLAGSWFWSDGSYVTLPSLPLCPVGRCGALDLKKRSLEPTDCHEKLNQLCYRKPISD